MKKLVTVLFFNLLINYSQSLQVESVKNGIESNICDFPYLVTIQRNEKHRCGGGIIDEYHILTATHCFLNDKKEFSGGIYAVIAGVSNLKKINWNAQKVYVKKIVIASNFIPSTSISDIAVLKLVAPLRISEAYCTRALVLPERQDYKGYKARIAGYGDLLIQLEEVEPHSFREISVYHFEKLYYTDAIIISNDKCQQMWSKRENCFKTKKISEITKSIICAQTDNKNLNVNVRTCVGDSGSPLVVDNGTVVGVLSGGAKGCPDKRLASMYAKVFHFREFIKKALEDEEKCDVIYNKFLTVCLMDDKNEFKLSCFGKKKH